MLVKKMCCHHTIIITLSDIGITIYFIIFLILKIKFGAENKFRIRAFCVYSCNDHRLCSPICIKSECNQIEWSSVNGTEFPLRNLPFIATVKLDRKLINIFAKLNLVLSFSIYYD